MANNKWQKQYYSKKKKNDGFLRVRPGCNLKVRLVGKPVKIVRVFTSDERCIPINSEETGHKLKEKYPSKIDNVSVRYSCWCFDRHDDRMKILDMPMSVADVIGNRVLLTGKTISDIEKGCDWKISTNGEKGMKVRYKVNYIEESCLTAVEQNMVEIQKLDKKRPYDLTEMFPCCGFKEAEAKMERTVD